MTGALGSEKRPQRITLVTLSFNQREFLERTIRSVIEQDYPHVEYIIVDPGSTDGSRELILQHKDRIACAVLEPDLGPSDGLNKGFERATGDIYGFLNADDLLEPKALSRVSAHFDTNRDCDILMGNGWIIDKTDRRLRHIRARGFTPRRYLHSGSAWLQQSTFFRAPLLREVGGFNVSNRSSWDGELFLKMALRGARLQYIRHDLASFRLHGDSITSRIQKGGLDEVVQAYHADTRRVFEEAMGRSWTVADDILSVAYRFLRATSRPAEHLDLIRSRVGGLNTDWIEASKRYRSRL